jgi:hypothetical protein
MVLFDQDLNNDTRKSLGKALQRLGDTFQQQESPSKKQADSDPEFQQIAFYAVLDTVRRQEIASRNAATKELNVA